MPQKNHLTIANNANMFVKSVLTLKGFGTFDSSYATYIYVPRIDLNLVI